MPPLLDTRALVLAGLLVVGALAVMVAMHEQHYRRRHAQLAAGRLEGWAGTVDARLGALERVVGGDHSL